MKTYWLVLSTDGYGVVVESGKLKTVVDAWKEIKNYREFDKKNRIIGAKYLVSKREETDDTIYETIGKVYRRGNKIFFKPI